MDQVNKYSIGQIVSYNGIEVTILSIKINLGNVSYEVKNSRNKEQFWIKENMIKNN